MLRQPTSLLQHLTMLARPASDLLRRTLEINMTTLSARITAVLLIYRILSGDISGVRPRLQ